MGLVNLLGIAEAYGSSILWNHKSKWKRGVKMGEDAPSEASESIPHSFVKGSIFFFLERLIQGRKVHFSFSSAFPSLASNHHSALFPSCFSPSCTCCSFAWHWFLSFGPQCTISYPSSGRDGLSKKSSSFHPRRTKIGPAISDQPQVAFQVNPKPFTMMDSHLAVLILLLVALELAASKSQVKSRKFNHFCPLNSSQFPWID